MDFVICWKSGHCVLNNHTGNTSSTSPQPRGDIRTPLEEAAAITLRFHSGTELCETLVPEGTERKREVRATVRWGLYPKSKKDNWSWKIFLKR